MKITLRIISVDDKKNVEFAVWGTSERCGVLVMPLHDFYAFDDALLKGYGDNYNLDNVNLLP